MKYTLKLKLWNSNRVFHESLEPGELARLVVRVNEMLCTSRQAVSLVQAQADMIEHYIHVEVEEWAEDTRRQTSKQQ